MVPIPIRFVLLGLACAWVVLVPIWARRGYDRTGHSSASRRAWTYFGIGMEAMALGFVGLAISFYLAPGEATAVVVASALSLGVGGFAIATSVGLLGRI